ncbi:hypothetical protein ABLN72_11105, partial [Mycobacterium tuberculosis]
SVLRSVINLVFNLQASQHFHCFRIYRETLSRFSCARFNVELDVVVEGEHDGGTVDRLVPIPVAAGDDDAV